jgi:hypothetical protein
MTRMVNEALDRARDQVEDIQERQSLSLSLSLSFVFNQSFHKIFVLF